MSSVERTAAVLLIARVLELIGQTRERAFTGAAELEAMDAEALEAAEAYVAWRSELGATEAPAEPPAVLHCFWCGHLGGPYSDCPCPHCGELEPTSLITDHCPECGEEDIDLRALCPKCGGL